MRWGWIIAAGLVAGPGAGRAFSPPAGCEAFLTVQARSCLVTHYWRCVGDPEGQKWALTIDEQGPLHLLRTDEEYRWLEIYQLRDRLRQILMLPEPDPASLTELLNTGADSATFSEEVHWAGSRVDTYKITGFDRLTGEKAVIDGEELLVTQFAYSVGSASGQVSYKVSGQQFVSPRWRLFFGGVETVEEREGTSSTEDASPVEFILPGEEGFLANTPQHDCGATLSAWPSRNAMKEQRHGL